MTNPPAGLLVNLAILKVNWDENRDLVHNFMPLMGYAISQLDHDIVTVDELKTKIRDVAKFDIAAAALEVMIRRAVRAPYNFVIKSDKTFTRIIDPAQVIAFLDDQTSLTIKFESLATSFKAFCDIRFPGLPIPDPAVAFFSVLFDIAPRMIESASALDHLETELEGENSGTLKYRAASYVKLLWETRNSQFDTLQTFFQGAVLAESFYYTSPENVRAKFRAVRVIYDVDVLSRILGFTSIPEREAALEMHQMVLKTQAKPVVFLHTRGELYSIFDAARHQRRFGRLKGQRPGDIFDWLDQSGFTVSDIELLLGRLDDIIADCNIIIEEPPPYTTELGIDENALAARIRQEVDYLSDAALERDIRSLSAVYRIRRGQVKKYLESCNAIFVTGNTSLAKASTSFFNSEYGASDAPVCITSHVFGMLLWLKTVDKKGAIPADVLVANSLAALKPDRSLWSKYMAEVERLRAKNDITEADYAVLAHSMEARQELMDLSFGDSDAFALGGVADVLARARNSIILEAGIQVKAAIHQAETERAAATSAIRDLDRAITRLARIIGYTSSTIIIALGMVIISRSQEVNLWAIIIDPSRMANLSLINWIALGFSVVVLLLGAVGLTTGWSLIGPIGKISRFLAKRTLGGPNDMIKKVDP